MLKLVNRTRSQGSRFTFCTDLRDVASRIPLACPPIILSFSLSLSLSLYPPRSLSLVSSLQPRLFRGEPSTPDSVAPTMEGSHCLRGLSLPSIAKYTPASPPVAPPVPCRFYSLSLPLSFSCTSSPDLRRRPCGGFRRATFALPVWNLLTALVCARDRSPASLDRGHAVGVLGFFDTPAVLLPFERPGATLVKRSIR